MKKAENVDAQDVDILVLGGGYSGLWGAVNAEDVASENGATLNITLVSRDDYLIHRPRMYECNPDSLLVPLRPLLDPVGVDFCQGNAISIDPEGAQVRVDTHSGEKHFHYGKLILATGSELLSLPIPGVSEYAFNIDSYVGAKAFDEQLKTLGAAFDDEASRTFVIVGSGMTGLELATEMRDRIEQHMGAECAAEARVVLIERAGEVGPLFGDSPRPVIEEALRVANVEVRLDVSVAKITETSVTLTTGDVIPSRTTVITIGMRASSLTNQIPAASDESGRLHVDSYLRVKGVDNIIATGDVAHVYVDDGHIALMSCQNSRTMGKYAGRNAAAGLLGVELTPYRQADYTTCLDLGRYGAVYTEEFERKLTYHGQKAKERKRMINREMIYPPAPLGRKHIIEKMRIDHRGR